MSLLRRFRAGPVLSYSGSYGLIFTMMTCIISFLSQQEQPFSLQVIHLAVELPGKNYLFQVSIYI